MGARKGGVTTEIWPIPWYGPGSRIIWHTRPPPSQGAGGTDEGAKEGQLEPTGRPSKRLQCSPKGLTSHQLLKDLAKAGVKEIEAPMVGWDALLDEGEQEGRISDSKALGRCKRCKEMLKNGPDKVGRTQRLGDLS